MMLCCRFIAVGSKLGWGFLGVLVPAVVLAIVALMALTAGQVRAESEPETEEPAPVVCDGLYALTMAVNTMTLKKQGELTKYSYSSDRECEMSLTLRDVSSEDNPVDKTKSCTVAGDADREWLFDRCHRRHDRRVRDR